MSQNLTPAPKTQANGTPEYWAIQLDAEGREVRTLRRATSKEAYEVVYGWLNAKPAPADVATMRVEVRAFGVGETVLEFRRNWHRTPAHKLAPPPNRKNERARLARLRESAEMPAAPSLGRGASPAVVAAIELAASLGVAS